MKTRILALVMLVVMLFALASCGAKPELDLKAAKKTLEKAKYTVSYTKDADELGVGYVQMLTASDKKGEERITIMEFADSKLAKLAYEQRKMIFDCNLSEYEMEIEYLELEIEYYEYLIKEYEDDLDDEDILDAYEEELEELQDKLDEEIEDMEEYKESYVFGRSGCFFWYGTAGALEDSKN